MPPGISGWFLSNDKWVFVSFVPELNLSAARQAGGAIHCFDMVYPQPAKRAYDYVVTRISRSLRPLETGHGTTPGS